MKTLVNSWFWAILLCATLGLAPFFPEPHIWGKLRWIEGGAIGMGPLDWWDFFAHAAPWALLGRLVFYQLLSFFEKSSKMKHFNLLVTCFLMGQFLGCANGQTAENPAAKISAGAFEKMLLETTTAQLLDVRTPAEFATGHLQNAVNLDFNGSDFQKQVGALDQGRDVFVYCAVGGRSAKAADLLKKSGFTKVHDLAGGINGWKAAGKPVVK